MSTSTMNCTRCHGAGLVDHWRRDGSKVSHLLRWSRHFEAPDLEQLCAAIKGRKPRTVRSKRPDDPRAWLLWRLIRFHTGKDVTLPMTSTLANEGDPFVPTIDAAARVIAQHFTGKDSIGSARWRHAIHGESPADLAILSIPVTNGDKPFEESLELE